jgi:hypothetical protein
MTLLRHLAVSIPAMVLACGLTAARADSLPSALPSLALDPPPSSMWKGFSVGTEVFAFSGGGKGFKGGAGGGLTAGYNHVFANNVVVGFDSSFGYTSSGFKYSNIKGYDFSTFNLKVGYDMGRFMPYVTSGVVLARPNIWSGGYGGPSDSINNLFDSSSGHLNKAVSVGAGFDYAITDKLSVGLSVNVVNGNNANDWLTSPWPSGFPHH